MISTTSTKKATRYPFFKVEVKFLREKVGKETEDLGNGRLFVDHLWVIGGTLLDILVSDL